MKRHVAVMTLLLAGSALTFTALAAPPQNKAPGHEHRAGPPGQSHGHKQARGKGKQDHTSYEARRQEDHRGNRRDSYHRSLLDAGITTILAREYAHRYGNFDGHSSLPPGIRMNLERGKPLPPGIAKKLHSGAFLDHLPRHSGYEWQAAGTDLILVSLASGIIADILYDVFD